MENINIRPELTAISNGVSASAKLLLSLYHKDMKVLDYGIGLGRNTKYFIENGVSTKDMYGIDIPEQLKRETKGLMDLKDKGVFIGLLKDVTNKKFNLILNSFVLNVIPSDDDKLEVLTNIYNLLTDHGTAIIEVRADKDSIAESKTSIPYENGYLLGKSETNKTYQEYITKDKLHELCTKSKLKVIKHVFDSSNHYVICGKQFIKNPLTMWTR